MTTLAALVALDPDPGNGQAVQIGDGTWRHAIEIADPSAGASVVWHDVTGFWCGYEYTRGADQYQGRYRASVANVELCTDTDALAPWNDDTSGTFGVHVELGPGLLIRSVFFRVVGGVVVESDVRFTNKVESWSDASYSQGKIRRHLIVARDTLTSLVTLPLEAQSEENWSDRMFNWLVDTAWPYGSLIYGAQFEADTTTPILLLPDRPATTSALNELDATLDPVGLVWYTNRRGQLVVRPRVDDTFHADAFAAGATGDEWPGSPDGPQFAWYACQDDVTSPAVSYAQDNAVDPFGLDRTERAIINHVKVTYPSGAFDDDDATSIARYDRKTMQASWIAANDVVAAAILGSRSFATVEARPLHTTVDLIGFLPGAAGLDFLYPVSIAHRNNDTGLAAFANGWVRSLREQVTPRGCEVDWSLTITADVYQTSSEAGLLPVEDLALVDVTDTDAEFSWSNPTQVITPTNTQIRLMNSASLWMTVAYPITGAIWHGLEPSTTYTFQVRLIRVVDGLITHQSPLREITFTTDPTTVPVVDGDGDVTLPEPDEDCTLEWELQESDDGGVTFITIDDGEVLAPPWTITLDFDALDPEKMYRVRSREVCSGTPGAWHVGDTFGPACTTPPAVADPPFDDPDLVAYLPGLCPPDIIVETVSDQTAMHGPQFGTVEMDDDGNIVLVSADEGPVVFGINPPLLDDLTGDATIAARVKLSTQPADPVNPVLLFSAVGLGLWAVPEGAGWKLRGTAHEEGEGVTAITDDLELDLDTWYDLSLTHDVAAGDLRAYIDGVDAVSALGTVGARHDPGLYRIDNAAASRGTNYAVWDTVLAYAPPPLAGIVHTWDFSTLSSPSYGLAVTAIVDSVAGKTLSRVGTATTLDHPLGGGSTLLPCRNISTANERLRTPGVPELLPGYAQPFGISWIGRINTAGGNGTWWDLDDNSPRPHSYGDGSWRMNAGTLLTDGTSDTGVHTFFAEFNGTSSKLYIDGVNVTTGNAGTAGVGDLIALFNVQPGGNAGDVTIGELSIITGTHTPTEIATEHQRLFDKWVNGPHGGTITTAGGYTYHTFTQSGVFHPGPNTPLSIDYLVVGGGGGGGSNMAGGGGGGGAASGSTTVSAAQTVTIGAGGGGGANSSGSAGSNSSLGSIATGNGGGYGGKGSTSSAAGGNGGCGGGGGADNTGSGKAGGTGSQGGGGGTGESAGGGSAGSNPWCAGGGGGAGGTAGGNGSGSTGGAGGAGVEWPTSSGVFYGGGGGGGCTWGGGGGTGGAGGSGGGGAGANGTTTNGTAGTANRGGGGGGAGSNLAQGGAGGSGVVIIRYVTP